ncbi:MAG: outer membrane protein FlgP [Campylobacterota bacterium]|nr:outer membrane protein FlgP [Campylobacterota bacterium]
MKYSLVLASLLAASSLFAAQQVQPQVQTVDTATLQQTNDELVQVKKELSKVRNEIQNVHDKAVDDAYEQVLKENKKLTITVVGQGVAPMNTTSPAQAYALAKRAAIADGYRAIAEKLKGVRVEGQDTIKNMMVQKSTVRTQVEALVKYANVVETAFKEGLCEVEMEIVISHADFAQ